MSTTTASPGTLSKLVSRHEVAERTTAFRFEKPLNWTFKAGQFLEMTLLDPAETDAEGNVRAFSIASAPHEETLMVATRMRDRAFKRMLNTMPLGSAVRIEMATDSTNHPVRKSGVGGSVEQPGEHDEGQKINGVGGAINGDDDRARRDLPARSRYRWLPGE